MRSYKEVFFVPFNYDNATFLFAKNNSMSLLAETSSESSNKEHTPLTTTINHGLQPEEKHTYVSGKVLKQTTLWHINRNAAKMGRERHSPMYPTKRHRKEILLRLGL